MKIAISRDTPFMVTLKSAAGFSIAVTALVGMLAGLTGTNPEGVDWLFYISALAGAIAGVVLAGPGSRK